MVELENYLEGGLVLQYGEPDDTTKDESEIICGIWWRYLVQTYHL